MPFNYGATLFWKDIAKADYKVFYNKLYNLRFKIAENENIDNLFNMDETPIMF